MRFFKHNTATCTSKEVALNRLARLNPTRMAEAFIRILGQYEEYSRFNSRAREAIEKGREDLFLDANFMRTNALEIVLVEIRRISECCERRYGASLNIPENLTPEEMVDVIADFCQLYNDSGCNNVAMFK